VRCALESFDASGHNYYAFPIFITPEYPLSRDQLYARLREHGIHARRYFYPLISDFPMYRDLPSAGKGAVAVAHEVSARILCLPMFPDLPREEQDRIAHLIATPSSVAAAS
jgi:dTDP-4-amino-4,6-dideoxygalactose transaminase